MTHYPFYAVNSCIAVLAMVGDFVLSISKKLRVNEQLMCFLNVEMAGTTTSITTSINVCQSVLGNK